MVGHLRRALSWGKGRKGHDSFDDDEGDEKRFEMDDEGQESLKRSEEKTQSHQSLGLSEPQSARSEHPVGPRALHAAEGIEREDSASQRHSSNSDNQTLSDSCIIVTRNVSQDLPPVSQTKIEERDARGVAMSLGDIVSGLEEILASAQDGASDEVPLSELREKIAQAQKKLGKLKTSAEKLKRDFDNELSECRTLLGDAEEVKKGLEKRVEDMRNHCDQVTMERASISLEGIGRDLPPIFDITNKIEQTAEIVREGVSILRNRMSTITTLHDLEISDFLNFFFPGVFAQCRYMVDEFFKRSARYFRGDGEDIPDDPMSGMDSLTVDFMYKHLRHYFQTLFPLSGDAKKEAYQYIVNTVAAQNALGEKHGLSPGDVVVVVGCHTLEVVIEFYLNILVSCALQLPPGDFTSDCGQTIHRDSNTQWDLGPSSTPPTNKVVVIWPALKKRTDEGHGTRLLTKRFVLPMESHSRSETRAVFFTHDTRYSQRDMGMIEQKMGSTPAADEAPGDEAERPSRVGPAPRRGIQTRTAPGSSVQTDSTTNFTLHASSEVLPSNGDRDERATGDSAADFRSPSWSVDHDAGSIIGAAFSSTQEPARPPPVPAANAGSRNRRVASPVRQQASNSKTGLRATPAHDPMVEDSEDVQKGITDPHGISEQNDAGSTTAVAGSSVASVHGYDIMSDSPESDGAIDREKMSEPVHASSSTTVPRALQSVASQMAWIFRIPTESSAKNSGGRPVNSHNEEENTRESINVRQAGNRVRSVPDLKKTKFTSLYLAGKQESKDSITGGDGHGSVDTPESEWTLSFQNMMAWDELVELLKEPECITKLQIRAEWEKSLRFQDERVASTEGNAAGGITGGEAEGNGEQEGVSAPKELANGLTLQGFSFFCDRVMELADQFNRGL